MTAFENIVFGKSSLPALSVTVLLMVALPVASFFWWRRKHKEQTHLSYLIAGALGFLVSARVLELGAHYLCLLSENPVSRFINGSTVAYVLYGAATAGVFEECGRHVVLKYILKKHRTRENAVLYGIGHGGIEVLAVLLPSMALYLAIAALFTQGSVEDALAALKITEGTAAAALPSVQAAAAFDFAAIALNVMERLFAMLAHVGLSVVVFYGVQSAKKAWLPLAILLHMLMDALPALYQRGAAPLWAVELWVALWAAVIVLIAARLYKKMSVQAA